jgi:hypothetical protein
VEVDGSSQGATDTLGQPTTREPGGTVCTMTWEREGLIMEFSNFGGADPGLYGSFWTAQISGVTGRRPRDCSPGCGSGACANATLQRKRSTSLGRSSATCSTPGSSPAAVTFKRGL